MASFKVGPVSCWEGCWLNPPPKLPNPKPPVGSSNYPKARGLLFHVTSSTALLARCQHIAVGKLQSLIVRVLRVSCAGHQVIKWGCTWIYVLHSSWRSLAVEHNLIMQNLDQSTLPTPTLPHLETTKPLAWLHWPPLRPPDSFMDRPPRRSPPVERRHSDCARWSGRSRARRRRAGTRSPATCRFQPGPGLAGCAKWGPKLGIGGGGISVDETRLLSLFMSHEGGSQSKLASNSLVSATSPANDRKVVVRGRGWGVVVLVSGQKDQQGMQGYARIRKVQVFSTWWGDLGGPLPARSCRKSLTRH